MELQHAGEDVFRLSNAALFIDDYLGAYPNGICLSSFVSCPNYYGWYNRGGWCALLHSGFMDLGFCPDTLNVAGADCQNGSMP